MTEDQYRKGRNYEVLIRRAFNCEKGRKYGARAELFIELVKLELEDENSIEYSWHFQKLSNYLAKALSKLRRRKRYYNSDDEFSSILVKLNNVGNTDDLAKVASLGLAKIIECENRLRESG